MLLQRIADGDSSAVAQCVEQYGNLVWSTARKWSANYGDAEDAVQEIFFDLWKSASRFNPEIASEPAFIMMIARRRLIDRRRKSVGQPDTKELSDEQPALSQQDPSFIVQKGEEAAIATAFLKTLRPEERNVLIMSVQQGLSHLQISERCGLPLGSVKTHIRRGLARLRERLTRSMADSLAESSSWSDS